MKIRILRASDAQMYWEIRLEALKNNPEAFASSYEELITRKSPIEQVAKNLEQDNCYTFGAFNKEELVGVVTLVQEHQFKLRHRASIFAMYVKPEKRGSGIGKALMRTAIQKAESVKEIMKLNLTVISTNHAAKALYKSLGFKLFGFEEKALMVGNTFYDEEHMVRFLESTAGPNPND